MSFVTFRRHYVDAVLGEVGPAGDVLDVGGERDRRGSFETPPGWKTLNVDPTTKPDFCGSAEEMPVVDASFDLVVLTEVLEHVESPKRVLSESFRALRPGGRIVATMPFLYGVHGDPHDFRRWTSERLHAALSAAAFTQVEVTPMGGIVSVVSDLVEQYCQSHYRDGLRPPLAARGFRFLVRKGLWRTLLQLDRQARYPEQITTGYAATGRRPLVEGRR